MSEKFRHIRSAEEAHVLEPEEFEMRFAAFISDPVAFLEKVRLEYLDTHEGNSTELVYDVLNEVGGYIKHMSETLYVPHNPMLDTLVVSETLNEYANQTRCLFGLLQKAGYTKAEVQMWTAITLEGLSKTEELESRGELVILNEVYGTE